MSVDLDPYFGVCANSVVVLRCQSLNAKHSLQARIFVDLHDPGRAFKVHFRVIESNGIRTGTLPDVRLIRVVIDCNVVTR